MAIVLIVLKLPPPITLKRITNITVVFGMCWQIIFASNDDTKNTGINHRANPPHPCNIKLSTLSTPRYVHSINTIIEYATKGSIMLFKRFFVNITKLSLS